MTRPAYALRAAALAVSASLAVVLSACGASDPAPGAPAQAGAAQPGTPPGTVAPRPGRPALSEARLAALADTEIAGYRRTVISKQKNVVMLRYDGAPNPKGAYASVTVTLEPCSLCQPMDLGTWKANEWLRAGVPKPVAADPDLVFDLHEVALPGGRRAIGLYTEGIAPGPHEAGAYVPVAHGRQLWFNDAVNQIHVDVAAMGALPRTREEVRASMSRADLEAAALAVYGAFAGEFDEPGPGRG